METLQVKELSEIESYVLIGQPLDNHGFLFVSQIENLGEFKKALTRAMTLNPEFTRSMRIFIGVLSECLLNIPTVKRAFMAQGN